MTEFIIVGRGLAASALMHRFYTSNISFKVIGCAHMSRCSQVAAGIWNPVVFKRMSKSWMAETLIEELNDFYSDCEKRLNKKLIHHRSIAKPFVEEQEKTLWLKRANGELNDFLNTEIKHEIHHDLLNCPIDGSYGRVEKSGYLEMSVFLEQTAQYFDTRIMDEEFVHEKLIVTESYVEYNGLQAKKIIFCEGHLVSRNPLFNWLPLKPAKGEIVTLQAEKLNLKQHIFNKNGFVLRLANGDFKAGATYAWDDLSDEPTAKARQQLEEKLKELITCEYSITAHHAGVRPSSSDRRPIVGAHPAHKNCFVFNGLGTKGVMLIPYFSKNFVLFYLQKAELAPEVNVKRFYKLYEAQQNKRDDADRPPRIC